MVNLAERKSEVTIYDSPGQFVGYANINGITFTPEDVIMHLGLRRPENPSEADGVAKIYLGLAHAKRIMLVLTYLVGEHEKFFGEIETEVDARLTEAGRKELTERLKLQQEEAKQGDVTGNK